MYSLGELPSDLDKQDESLGPPPAWFRPESGISTPEQAAAAWYSYPYAFQTGYLSGLGDREGEVEVNPIEAIQDLKFNQEMNKNIPPEASRYTTIDPLSPLFRNNKAKYGFGEITMGDASLRILGLAMLISNFYHGFKRNNDSLLWGFLWIFLGPIGIALSLAQGYGKPAH